jgi:hypothetical protein
MANYGGRSFTTFQNLNLRGLQQTAQIASPMIRMEMGGTAANKIGTMTVNTTYIDQDYAWTLPAKTGTFPISGTFSVDFPAVAATTFNFSTAITVTGIRAEDGLVVSLDSALTSTGRILVGAVPSTNTITLYFVNIGCATNGLYAVTGGYTAVR